MSSSFPPAPAAAPVPPPLRLAKGAWGGAWTVLYGCLGLLKGLGGVWTVGLMTGLCRWGAASIQARTSGETDSDLPQRLNSLIERFPALMGASLVPWLWAGAALSAACIVSGSGVVGRSDFARRATIALLVASGLHSVGTVVAWGVQVMPVFDAWIAEFGELTEQIQRQSPGAGPDLTMLLNSSAAQQLVWEGAMQIVHLGLLGLLIARLAGRDCRAWCGEAPETRVAAPAVRG